MHARESKAPRLHYAWVIVGTGTLCIFACLGFGRFALGMILPSMASGLRLSYAQLGYISTGNFVGYLASVLVCAPIAARIGSRRLVFLALLLVGTSMLLMSRAAGFASLLALYTLTGFGSGAANVPVMGLVARWFHSAKRGRAAGFVAIGSGFAIVISGRLIPFINRLQGADGWRTSWLVLGLAVTAIAFVSVLLLRNRPEDKGSEPFGADRVAAGTSRSLAAAASVVVGSRPVYLLGAVYALFGFTYAIYVTFIVTSLVRERGVSESVAGSFWSWVGLLSLLSGPVFGTLSDRIGRRAGLALVFFLQMLAYALAAGHLPMPFIYLSIGFFGVAAWSIPSIMVAAVSDYVGPDHALRAFGLITFIFGIGQIAGPSIAGLVAERTGSFSASFLLAAALAAAAIALCSLLTKPGQSVARSRAGAELAGGS